MLKGSHLAVMGPWPVARVLLVTCPQVLGRGSSKPDTRKRQTVPGPLGTSSRPPGPRHPRPFSLNQYYLHYLSVGPTAGELERHHGSRSSCGQEAKPKGGTRGPNHPLAWGATGHCMEWGHEAATPQRQTQDDGIPTHGRCAHGEEVKGAMCSRRIQKSLLHQKRPRPTSKITSTVKDFMWPLWNDYGGAVANIRGQAEWAGALLSPGGTATSSHHSRPKKGSAHTAQHSSSAQPARPSRTRDSQDACAPTVRYGQTQAT